MYDEWSVTAVDDPHGPREETAEPARHVRDSLDFGGAVPEAIDAPGAEPPPAPVVVPRATVRQRASTLSTPRAGLHELPLSSESIAGIAALLQGDDRTSVLQRDGIEQIVANACAARATGMLGKLDSELHFTHSLVGRVDELQAMLAHLHSGFSEVVGRTATFQKQCNTLVEQCEAAEKMGRVVQENVSVYTALSSVARRLHAPPPSFVTQREFAGIVDQINTGIDFMQEHKSLSSEADSFLHKYMAQQSRAIGLIAAYVRNRLDYAQGQIEEEMGQQRQLTKAAIKVYVYTRFETLVGEMGTVLRLVDSNVDKRLDFKTLYEDCLARYFSVRTHLLRGFIAKSVGEIVSEDGGATASRVRALLLLAHEVCEEELTLCRRFFPARADTGLEKSFSTIMQPVSDAARSLVPLEASIDALCDHVSLIRTLGGPRDDLDDRPDGLDYEKVFAPLLRSVQDRIMYQVRCAVTDDIDNFTPGEGDLNYPARFVQAREESATMAQHQDSVDMSIMYAGWYPTLKTGVTLLSRVYQTVNSQVFDRLAHEVVHSTVHSLMKASSLLDRKASPRDAALFLMRHLLLFKERIASFDIEFIEPEIGLDLSTIFGAFAEARERGELLSTAGMYKIAQQGFFGFVKNMVDAKKELDSILRTNINTFVRDAAAELFANGQHPLGELGPASVETTSRDVRLQVGQLRRQIDVYLDDPRTCSILYGMVHDSLLELLAKAWHDDKGALHLQKAFASVVELNDWLDAEFTADASG